MKRFKEAVKMKAPTFWRALKTVEGKLKVLLNLAQVLTSRAIRVSVAPGVSFNVYDKTVCAIEPFTARSKEVEMFEEMQAFLRETKDKTCLLDIGAFYGVFSMAFTCNDPARRAYAIEPSSEAFRILKAHARMNPALNINPFQVALGSAKGKVKMMYDGLMLCLPRKSELLPSSAGVEAFTLDDFVTKKNISPDVIKIDTEGMEFHILEGGRDFFKRNQPDIFLEVHAEYLRRMGISVAQLVELIHSLGYGIYDLRSKLIEEPIFALSCKPNCRVICSKKTMSCPDGIKERKGLMSEGPLVSVIIPVYNRADFLSKAVISVLKQNYQNFEIIVVDDHSTEDIKQSLDRQVDARIHFTRNEGAKGPAGARNTGMKAAKGEYIAFLDSDDEFLENHLEDSVSVLEKEPGAHLVFGKALYYTEDLREVDYMGPNLIKKISKITNVNDKGKYLVFPDLLFKFILQEGCFFNLSSVVTRRKIVDEGFLMREDLFSVEDMEYWQRLSRTHRFSYLKGAQINYLIHSNNLSVTSREKQSEQALGAWLKVYYVMLNYDFLDEDDKKIINEHIARTCFDLGYYKKKAGCLTEAQEFYLKSLRHRFGWWTIKAYLTTRLLCAWGALRRNKR